MKNNILILCSGTRVQLVEYFLKEFKGKGTVVCADSSTYAPTLYVADKGYVVPKITEPHYIDELLTICEKEEIKAVFSLIDPELSLLSKERQRFERNGITVIVSDEKTIELCFDKYDTAQFLKTIGLPYIPSYLSKDSVVTALNDKSIQFPLFQKPKNGSCSMGIEKVTNLSELKQYDGIMYQQFMNGTEYGVDVFVDLKTRKIVDMFIKKKLLMRAGETDKSISVKNEALKQTVETFVNALDFYGQIDIDVFEVDGKFYISEVNPRFGGGYLHAYECGVNFPKYILNYLENHDNPTFETLNYEEGIAMMKYLSVVVKKQEEFINE